MGYRSKSSMENLIWLLRTLRSILSSGLVSRDPNAVLHELETCGAIPTSLLVNPLDTLDHFKLLLAV